MGKEIRKLILKFFVILFILLSILVIANLIPTKYIEKNVKESLTVFKTEGYFPKINFTYNYLLDNYTDALMINTAYSVDSCEPLKSAILMRRNYRANEDLVLEKIDNENNTIKNLEDTLSGTNNIYYEYSRYWHGYMIYLRPLLIFLNYLQIRVLLTIVIISLSAILIYLTYKKINIYVSLATIIMLFIANFYFIGLSLQYSAVFIIMLAFSIYIILKREHIKEIASLFFIIGMLTSFFDLLTTPILTLGVPLIYYLLIEDDRENLKSLVKISIYWFLGYSIMWIIKWIVSDCLYQTGTIQRAIQKIRLLSQSKESFVPTALDVIRNNMMYISKIAIIILLVFAYISSLIDIKNIKTKIPYIIIALIPFIWFILIKNHSYVHARFTFRNLLLTILALSTITMESLKNYLYSLKINKIN